MQRMTLKTGVGFVVLLLGIALTACTGAPPKPVELQGKWMAVAREPGIPGRSGQVGFVIEFLGDHTVTLPSGKRKWTQLDDGRIKIEDPGLTMYGSVQEDVLSITMADETKVIFKKLK